MKIETGEKRDMDSEWSIGVALPALHPALHLVEVVDDLHPVPFLQSSRTC